MVSTLVICDLAGVSDFDKAVLLRKYRADTEKSIEQWNEIGKEFVSYSEVSEPEITEPENTEPEKSTRRKVKSDTQN